MIGRAASSTSWSTQWIAIGATARPPISPGFEALGNTWYVGGPWFPIEHHGSAETLLFLAMDECWGVSFYVVCDENLIPALPAVIPHYP